MTPRQLVRLALLLARIPTNGATATSFGNDYCQDLGDRGVTCTLASSCTPATEVLLISETHTSGRDGDVSRVRKPRGSPPSFVNSQSWNQEQSIHLTE